MVTVFTCWFGTRARLATMHNGSRLELWGGFECSVVRIGDFFRNSIIETGHAQRIGDLAGLSSLGIKKARYPVLWETIAPDTPDACDWAWHDERLGELRRIGIEPIAGLLHHGSGPAYTNLLDVRFPTLFAKHAYRVAARYPWIKLYTPVNEPLTTARFSCLYGHWYPHHQNMRDFLRALVNQCKAIVLAMRAIRLVTPDAALVQTEDLGRVFSTPALSYQADFENERRWLGFDLLDGRVDRRHAWHSTLLANGIDERDLGLFLEWNSRPDVIGINHYVTSDRYLDQKLYDYPAHSRGGNQQHRYADVEAVRVQALSAELGMKARLSEAYTRYGLPVAATEVHLGCTREDQLRWLSEAWTAAEQLRAEGQDIRAITVWSLLGSMDWSSLLVHKRGDYEPGAFDIRTPQPRRTAIATAAHSLATTGSLTHPVLEGEGWWGRDDRYYTAPLDASDGARAHAANIVIASSGFPTFARLLAFICRKRGLASSVVDMADIRGDVQLLKQRIAANRGWAVINADATLIVQNTKSPILSTAEQLAQACAGVCIPLVHFSTALVFDGRLGRPYIESDVTSPECSRGFDLVLAELAVRSLCDKALIIRSGPLFGLDDEAADDGSTSMPLFLKGRASQNALSPTFAPDMLNAMLDLLIDGERGIWHLANAGQITAEDFAQALSGRHPVSMSASRRRVLSKYRNLTLGSERADIMPSLDAALARFWGAGQSPRAREPLRAAAE